jgi:hypothetical protein
MSPHSIVKLYANDHLNFEGVIVVTNYVPSGKRGRRGLTVKESWFTVAAGQVRRTVKGNELNLHIDLRNFQLGAGDIRVEFTSRTERMKKFESRSARFAAHMKKYQ